MTISKIIVNAQNKAYTLNGDALKIDMAYTTKSGNAPLSFNGFPGPLRSLMQYGKCAQASTPSPSSPVDIVCNNGAIKYGMPLTLNATRLYAYIKDGGLWVNSSDSYSIVVPVTVGKKYAIRLTNTASGTVGTIFRYGFSSRNTAGNTTTDLVQLTQWVRSTPQDIQFAELVADNPYLIIQMGAQKFATAISNGYIVVTEQTLYIDGTPEVLTIGQQTASVVDLLGVGDFVDEQDIISGLVTRRLKIKILDGTENWSAKDANGRSAITLNPQPAVTNLVRRLPFWCNYFQVLQNGESASALHSGVCYFYNAGLYVHYDQTDVTAFKAWLAELYAAGTPVIVIYPVEDYTEQVTPQPLNAQNGSNTISATAEVSPIDLMVEYLTQA